MAKVSHELSDGWSNAGDDKNALEKFTNTDLKNFSALQIQEFLAKTVQKVKFNFMIIRVHDHSSSIRVIKSSFFIETFTYRGYSANVGRL